MVHKGELMQGSQNGPQVRDDAGIWHGPWGRADAKVQKQSVETR